MYLVHPFRWGAGQKVCWLATFFRGETGGERPQEMRPRSAAFRTSAAKDHETPRIADAGKHAVALGCADLPQISLPMKSDQTGAGLRIYLRAYLRLSRMDRLYLTGLDGCGLHRRVKVYVKNRATDQHVRAAIRTTTVAIQGANSGTGLAPPAFHGSTPS